VNLYIKMICTFVFRLQILSVHAANRLPLQGMVHRDDCPEVSPGIPGQTRFWVPRHVPESMTRNAPKLHSTLLNASPVQEKWVLVLLSNQL
jgi:hypothetical protein